MKVLILSVGTGHGHNQVGSAIKNRIDSYENMQCEKLDTFKYIHPILGSSLAEGYLMATKYTPGFYGKFYHMAERRKPSDTLSVVRAVNSILARKLTDFLEDYRPEVTVCTHVFAAQMITRLKKRPLAGMTLGVVTDFTIHPYWEETDLDYYITPNEMLNEQALQKGIALEKICPVGIPIHEKFSSKVGKSSARDLLQLEDKPTVLVMGGSMGYGNILEVLEQLDTSPLDFQILCVCGNNASLKERIDEMLSRKKIYNYGFVNNIDLLMDASDCIITKPGGLTVSESLAKGLPMILVNPIPGQEERNAQFLVENGAAIAVTKDTSADLALEGILRNGFTQAKLLESVEKLARPHASSDVCDLILHSVKVL